MDKTLFYISGALYLWTEIIIGSYPVDNPIPEMPEFIALLFLLVVFLGIINFARILLPSNHGTKSASKASASKGAKRQKSRADLHAYESCGRLLTDTELRFFITLRDAIDGRALIAPKVRLEDIIHVRDDYKRHDRNALRSRIKSRHIDFVICDPADCGILAGLELDDPSHLRKDRRKRDHFINELFDAAGIRLIRIPTKRDYPRAVFQDLLDFLPEKKPAISGTGNFEFPAAPGLAISRDDDPEKNQARIIVFEENELAAALQNVENGGRSLYLHTILEKDAPAQVVREVASGGRLGCLIDLSTERLKLLKDSLCIHEKIHYPQDTEEAPHLNLYGESLHMVIQVAKEQEISAFAMCCPGS
jgi:hypothetical protein